MNDRFRQNHAARFTLTGWLTSTAVFALLYCTALPGGGFAQTHSGGTAGAIPAPSVTFQSLASFNGTDGKAPISNLIQGLDGGLYGTTNYFGGAVFRVTTNGRLTTLHTYTGNFVAALFQGPSGNLYGETAGGGNPRCNFGYGCGTIVRVSLDGSSVVLHSFSGTDGDDPQGGLLQAADGKFYGTTSDIEIGGNGTVFR